MLDNRDTEFQRIRDSEKATAPTAPASPPSIEKAWNVVLAPLIRTTLYAPDGQPPEGWTLAQDLRICKLWLKRWKGAQTPDLATFMAGLRKLYPTGKLTLKMLVADKDGSLYQRAITAYYHQQKRGASLIGDILKQAIERAG